MKFQADSKYVVKVEIQAKTDQVIGPQKSPTFEKNLSVPCTMRTQTGARNHKVFARQL